METKGARHSPFVVQQTTRGNGLSCRTMEAKISRMDITRIDRRCRRSGKHQVLEVAERMCKRSGELRQERLEGGSALGKKLEW